MKFTSSIIKKAWVIRKEAAIRFSCPVKEVSWKHCLEMAVNDSKFPEFKFENGKATVKKGRKKIAEIFDRSVFFKDTLWQNRYNQRFSLYFPQFKLSRGCDSLAEVKFFMDKYL